ncbi:MAG: winged helix-turn-helix domain-containing protein [Saprospiraceae bacterium]|nr:winged helix-turn-helix domain-containing protein [Saprospiraceae bacterium]
MTKIEQLYNSIQTLKELGVQLPQGLIEETNRVEEEIIKNDIIPALAETISPIIEQIQRGIILVVEYVPNEPLTVKLTRKRSFAIPEEQDINDVGIEKKEVIIKEKKDEISKPHRKVYPKRNKLDRSLPQIEDLIIPTVKALKQLGGIGNLHEIDKKVLEIEQFPTELTEIMHKTNNVGAKPQTEISYRLAWAKTYLKEYGIIENPSRGIWKLSSENIDEKEINPSDISQHFKTK